MSPNNYAIRVEKLSKRYRVGVRQGEQETLVGTVLASLRQPLNNWRQLRKLSRFDEEHDRSTLWALRDVSFDVAPGEVVGIVGRNGAGKSTLLKVIARITDPTEGRVTLDGRVASLLEVGTGFHPDLTGRENVYLNGTLLGMSRSEISQKFDAIVDFSGVEKYIDTPVKRYSSGMRVRLAFAVAAFLEPEILLIDEVLAVGDVEFQKKCLGKMDDIAHGGRTVLFVSHNMSAVLALCERAVYLDQGRMRALGPTTDVVEQYLTDSDQRQGQTHVNHHNPDAPLQIERAELIAVTQREAAETSVHVRLHCVATEPTPFTVEWHLLTGLGEALAFGSPEHFRRRSLDAPVGQFNLDIHVRDIPIGAGRYYFTFRLGSLTQRVYFDIFERAVAFDVEMYDPYGIGRSFSPKKGFGYFTFPDEFVITPLAQLNGGERSHV